MPAKTLRPIRPADPDAVELYEALTALVRVYQFRDRDTICCHDVSVTQCYALEALLRVGPCTLNELAAELYLDKSTASRVIQTLERKKYVTRREHPDDARARLFEPTAAGSLSADQGRVGRRAGRPDARLESRCPTGRDHPDQTTHLPRRGPIRGRVRTDRHRLRDSGGELIFILER